MSQAPPPPGWYPDPAGSPGTRWWDGQSWTGHVQQAPAGPSLYDQPVLLVNQKTKLVELTNEYAVLDGEGRQIGAVVQVGQSGVQKAVRLLSSLDQFLTHRLEVRDARGPVLVLTRPAKLVKSRVVVERPDGQPIGEIVQAGVFGRIRFDLVAGGQLVGAIQAENWRAWDFAITDAAGTEVARITKKWEGLARTMFTTADRYVVLVHYRLPEPLASMVIASALTVDTALKQDERGFN
ncbi:phospholipid scramblase-related protein [Blastococcus saxobsidens]|uniref:Uncharacterized protein n=1 Tax=Blastococcus saxobsidens (strain DD2) TaxID=1146883 RepID=H6RQR2_BLASD|nr:phospholipid scramblase-related protein [Blastococcus saxobsidens]CCG01589.1 conserved protein of unknown function [Blastococcus saxobsidens DD2]